MEHSLTGATWFWLFVPMLITVVLSIVTSRPAKSKSEGRG